MFKSYYLLLILPYLTSSEHLCTDIVPSVVKRQNEVDLKLNEANLRRIDNYFKINAWLSDLVTNPRNVYNVYLTSYQFTSFVVPRFVYNHNVLMFDFQIPQDTHEMFFIFFSQEVQTNNYGEQCGAKNIVMRLKPFGYPISNISMPENYQIYNNDDIVTSTFLSNGAVHTLRITNPTMGQWYGRVHQSWTDQNQHGSSNCRTLLSGQVGVNIQSNVNIINCDNLVNIDLQPYTIGTQSDYYKCFINSETPQFNLNLAMNIGEGIEFVILKVQGKKFISENEEAQFQCVLRVGEETNQNINLNFAPYINQWHYLGVFYGMNITSPSINDIPICEDIEYQAINETKLTTMTRLSSSSMFSYQYFVPELVNRNEILLSSDLFQTYRFDVFQSTDLGGVLTIEAFPNSTEDSLIVVCFGLERIVLPSSDRKCQSDMTTTEPLVFLNTNENTTSSSIVHIPYPESGLWYLTFGVFCETSPCQTSVNLRVESSSCSDTDCGEYGTCQLVISGSLIFSSCRCRYGFTGWLCTDPHHVPWFGDSLKSILFVTLTNAFFIPSIIFGIRRKYYTESLVYTLTMFFSTFYHACDEGSAYLGLCIVDYNALQYTDFFCAILSFWVTIIAMASVNRIATSLLHTGGAVLIAFGTVLNRFSMWLFLIPILSGSIVMVTSWIVHCRQSGKLFPGKKYLIFFFPAGVVLAGIGLILFALVQTTENYYLVHSIWHVTVALSILLLLPIRSIFFVDESNNNASETPFNTVLQSMDRMLSKF